MSRVYEALRRSELEKGNTHAFLDPDEFLANPEVQVATLPPPDALAWDEIVSFDPNHRDESRLVALTADNSLGAEKFRLLRARLRHLRERNQISRIVVTSAVPGEGKTLVSMNLAISMARQANERVLLLEGDLRRPMLAEHIGMPGFRGLDDWFANGDPIEHFLYRVRDLPLCILPAGVPRANPLEILQAPRFLNLYAQLSRSFTWILIDAPPLLPMADVSFWGRYADGLLLVSREGRTPKSVLQEGLTTLDNAKVIGVVRNDAHAIERGYYLRYYQGDKHYFRN